MIQLPWKTRGVLKKLNRIIICPPTIPFGISKELKTGTHRLTEALFTGFKR